MNIGQGGVWLSFPCKHSFFLALTYKERKECLLEEPYIQNISWGIIIENTPMCLLYKDDPKALDDPKSHLTLNSRASLCVTQ